MAIISWDALFKQLFLRFFQRQQLMVMTEYEVSHQAQKIDAVVICPTEAHRRRLIQTAFSFFTHHNLIEFKSTADRLTEAAYYLITSRARAYLHQTRGANLENTLSCIVSTGRPQKVLTRVPRLRFQCVEQGHYIANELLDTHLLVIAELPLEPQYYPLLLFAAGKKREEVLQTFVARSEIELIQIALTLYPETMRRIYTMPKGDYPTIEENINVWVDWFGIEPFVKAYLKFHRPDEFIAMMLSQEGVDRSALVQTLLSQNGVDGSDLMQMLIQQMDKKQARQLLQNILTQLEKEDNK